MLIMEKIYMCFENHNNTGNVRINIALWHILATIVAGEKQQVLYILSGCL